MKIAFLLILLCHSTWAAITADMIVMPDYGTRAILTRSVLSNMVIGAHGTLLYNGTNAGGTWMRTYVGASTDSSVGFSTPITVGSTNYSGAATNWMRFDSVTNLQYEYADIRLPNDGSSTVTNCLAAGVFTWCVTNNTVSDVSLDTLILYDSNGGAWAVAQVQIAANQGSTMLVSHAAISNTSSFGPAIPITPCKPYFMVLYKDALGGRCCVKAYDAGSYVLAGESCSAMNLGNTYLMELPIGYLGNIPQDIYKGPTFVKFDASNTDYTNIPPPFPSRNSIGAASIIRNGSF